MWEKQVVLNEVTRNYDDLIIHLISAKLLLTIINNTYYEERS